MRLLFICLLLFAPLTYAAELHVEPDRSSADLGSEFTMSVSFDAGDGSYNVVDGVITVPEGIIIRRVSTAGSVLSLWTEGPTYVRADRHIVFTGGSPNPLLFGKKLLFTIHADAAQAGTYSFEPHTVSAYRSDGTGALVRPEVQSKSIEVFAGGATKVVRTESSRNLQPLSAEVGSDPTLFGGKYFLSMYGGDTGSGVDYYEVTEGSFNPVRSDGLYVLADQSQRSRVHIAAVQHDGTREEISLNSSVLWPYGIGIGIVLVLLAAVWLLRKRFRV